MRHTPWSPKFYNILSFVSWIGVPFRIGVGFRIESDIEPDKVLVWLAVRLRVGSSEGNPLGFVETSIPPDRLVTPYPTRNARGDPACIESLSNQGIQKA